MRHFRRADLGQYLVDFGNLLVARRAGAIDHMQQQVGISRRFQRGMKGIHQGMRQVADESHGIGNHDIACAFNPQLARSRVERGKQLVCRIDARASQGIEQRGFTRVGITNQGDIEHIAAAARLALHTALPGQFLQPILQQLDPPPQQAAIGFELLFTRAAQTDPAALTLKVGPAAHQPGGQMFKLRQFNLQLALGTGGTQGKDVENQAVTIHHPAFQGAFQVTLLHRRQRVVENHQLRLGGRNHGGYFIHLAFSSEALGIRAVALATHFGNNQTTRRRSQQA